MTTAMVDSEITVQGEFDLAAAARFLTGFGPAGQPGAEAGALRVAFPLEGAWTPVGAVLRQRSPGAVAVEVHGPPEHAAAVLAQVRRMCSLDVDGTEFPAAGARDPVVSLLQQLRPGLRPVLFASPYEAACWAVLSHRVWMTQAVRLRRRLTERHGTEVDVGGSALRSFPPPAVLAKLEYMPGLSGQKMQRLRGIAEAAAAGALDAATLRAMSPDDALDQLRLLPGIGRFSAELILIRGAGHPDIFPQDESRLHEIMRDAYHLPAAGVPELAEIAEAWAPFRSWVSFLFRVEGEARLRESR
ncbi:DNA-3-methyladenine glycosylase 2 family protein [Amycolatopsis sp. SID8362]|uniref:DNA-3-methyladenine glycosylase family protein n=1 Tax=Amycolatopsis sp. SID8362 TaxID=2690346 RepID=UPI00136EF16D|nr:DNA-3-methyladenine glycosylase 2 family protein [Amycolatopsis sp. SID8362]NBH07748.1 DNA-3-methyladenine glycosylase 2 family protein [Amycolatopsis sp. SID8362]NED44443.1 DNA-3-methyladenine glycosylase 2 family protein [Amycolatopsis sp. SID8362]